MKDNEYIDFVTQLFEDNDKIAAKGLIAENSELTDGQAKLTEDLTRYDKSLNSLKTMRAKVRSLERENRQLKVELKELRELRDKLRSFIDSEEE